MWQWLSYPIQKTWFSSCMGTPCYHPLNQVRSLTLRRCPEAQPEVVLFTDVAFVKLLMLSICSPGPILHSIISLRILSTVVSLLWIVPLPYPDRLHIKSFPERCIPIPARYWCIRIHLLFFFFFEIIYFCVHTIFCPMRCSHMERTSASSQQYWRARRQSSSPRSLHMAWNVGFLMLEQHADPACDENNSVLPFEHSLSRTHVTLFEYESNVQQYFSGLYARSIGLSSETIAPLA